MPSGWGLLFTSVSIVAIEAKLLCHFLEKFISNSASGLDGQARKMGLDNIAKIVGLPIEDVHEVLRLPMSYWVVEFLAIGHLNGPDKFNSGRFEMTHTVFGEEFGKPLK
jgi:hypothetical protein